MKLILVAGMHRSGTSFVTELVRELGAETGTRLLPAGPDNPHGFFENLDVKQINDELLTRLGGTWDRPPVGLTPMWSRSAGLDGLRKRAEALIDSLLDMQDGESPVVIKDPRLSITGAFWNSVVAADVSLVPLRHPIEVIESLRHRNGTSPARAASLWTRYTVSALVDLPNPRIVPLHGLAGGSEEAMAALASYVELEVGIESALAIIRGRQRTWTPDRTLSPEVDGDEFKLATALFSVLDSTLDITTLRPLLENLALRWTSLPLVDPAHFASDEPGDLSQMVLQSTADQLTRARSDYENERLVLIETRSERDQARREARANAQQLADAKDEAVEAVRLHELKGAEMSAAIHDAESAFDAARAQQAAAESARDTATERKFEAQRAHRDATAALIATERRTELDVDHEAERDAAIREAQSQARRARAAERRLDRLTNRRSVRIALEASRPFRPLFRGLRRARRTTSRRPAGRRTPSDSEPARTATTHPRTPIVVEAPQWSPIIDRLMNVPPAIVVVPVFNAADEFEKCIRALMAWTPVRNEILVIDDGSTDPRIAELLVDVSAKPNVTVLKNEHNLGFTRTVNRGFDSTTHDVVMLNSDAQVGPNWLTNLRAAAYSGDRIASASAVSDNAGAFSMPEVGANLPTGLDHASTARLYSQGAFRYWPETPTGHGFCMYIRRDALDAVGVFDVEQFPRGYGEENDWSMRAIAAGWTNVVDDSTMVIHANAASFDPATKTALVAAARERVNALHPDYTARVHNFLDSGIEPTRQRSRSIDASGRSLAGSGVSTVRPRLLSVVQAGRGGTPQTNEDLMGASTDRYEPWILRSDGRLLQLHRFGTDGLHLVEEAECGAPLGSNRSSDPIYREFVARIVLTYGFEVVHVRHLFKHSQDDLADILRTLGVPSVLSFHDFFWICPNVHLLDENSVFCGGHCTTTPGDCDLPMPGSPVQVRLKDEWVHDWRRAVRARLTAFDRFVTTSTTAKGLMYEHYPELRARGIEVIPHGRDLDQGMSVATRPGGNRVTIVLIGNLSAPKGGHLLRSLLELDSERLLDVHIVGDCETEFEDLRCTFHGRYKRDDLTEIIVSIRPSFVALLSIWPETWSHTLTEAWALGIPVLVTALGGALVERVEENGGGWVIDDGDPRAALDLIRSITEDPVEWNKHAARASVRHQTTIDEMAARYHSVYDRARLRSQPECLEVEVRVTVDGEGKSPGSAHVRSLRRFHHPEVGRRILSTTDQRLIGGPRRPGSPNIVWIERNAVPSADVDGILRERDRRGTKIIVDLDDDLVHDAGLPRQFARYVPTMRHLVEAADLVTVSTATLKDVVTPWATRVEVIPNQLDETLWGSFDPSVTPRKTPDTVLDVLYMGSATHRADLELIREPVEEFSRRHGQNLRLHVVGGAPVSADEWFHRIAVPNRSKEYPDFVQWLRSIGGRFDFAVAPLENSEFNSSKSDLKFLEYSALGLPALFSDSPAYRSTVTDGVDGLLVDADADSWTAGLVELSSSGRRDAIRTEAMEHASRRTIGNTADAFADLLVRLIQSEPV